MSKLKKVLISIPDDVLCHTDEFAKNNNLSRSALVVRALDYYLKAKKIEDIEKSMIKGYEEMGTINLELAELAFAADSQATNLYEEILAERE